MNVAHCMENEIQALIFHPCLSLCHLFQMHNESFGWNVEAKPAMLNPLRFPPLWQTLIRDRPTSIILEKCFWDKYIYIYIIYIQISSSFQMSWYLSLSRWPWQKWVEEALGGDDFWKKRTTMQESEGGPKWNTEKMSKGSICLFFFATRETHAKSYKASNTLLAIQVRVRRWDLLWVSSWESWSGGSENMRATYRIPRILHTLKCPSMLHMKLHEVEVPRFF